MNSRPDPKSCWAGCSFSVKGLTSCLEIPQLSQVKMLRKIPWPGAE